MTKDLALLVGADQKWLSTTGFLDKIDANLKKAMALAKALRRLLGHDIALAADQFAADRFTTTSLTRVGDARVALHQRVQILGVKDQQVGPGQRGRGCRTPRAAQHRHLAEEMPGAEAQRLFLAQRDLDLACSDKIHRMGVRRPAAR